MLSFRGMLRYQNQMVHIHIRIGVRVCVWQEKRETGKSPNSSRTWLLAWNNTILLQ